MRIDTFSIKNFHGISSAQYDLHPEATVLLGTNSTGKSAILDALAILAGSYFLGIDAVDSLTIKNNDIRQEIRFETDGSARPIHHTPSELKATGEVHGVELEWSRERLSLSTKTRQVGSRPIADLAKDAYSKIKAGQHVVRPFLGYYSVARLGVQKKETHNQKKALTDLRAGYKNSLKKESSQWAAERWFAGLQSRAYARMGEASAIFEKVKAVLLSLFSGMENPLDGIHHDPETDKIFIRMRKSEGFIPSSFLSSGYESVLAMGFDIVYRIFVLNPHLGADAFDKTPGIALIDETDMHLHPKWQGRIIEDLRSAFPALQFVFTTHSPFVVQSLRNSRIIDLDAEHVRDVGDYVKKSIPEVAEEYMGMEELERSPYFMEQVKAAEEYFVLLKKSPDLDTEELKKVTEKLNNFEIRYDRDPAFVALLRAERLTSGVDEI